jgi:hypothetical protein
MNVRNYVKMRKAMNGEKGSEWIGQMDGERIYERRKPERWVFARRKWARSVSAFRKELFV